jgi:hypothetical protein
MRGYHFKVALLAFGVLLGYGGAFARYQAGYGLWGHPGFSQHHGHCAHHHRDACESDWDEPRQERAGTGVHSKTP